MEEFLAFLANNSYFCDKINHKNMKSLNVRHLSVGDLQQAAEVPALLDAFRVEWQLINTVNWADYPYRPTAMFRIAHCGDRILVQYRVSEETVRAVAPHDNGNVWEDSCCEFFCQPDDSPLYYNMECNCAGTLLVATGTGREGRVQASPAFVAAVDRWSSLGRGIIEEREAPAEWTMALVIPASTFFRHHITDLTGRDMRANFYKCGDKLRTPHFLSWNPITIPKPDFHRPDFFGGLTFE